MSEWCYRMYHLTSPFCCCRGCHRCRSSFGCNQLLLLLVMLLLMLLSLFLFFLLLQLLSSFRFASTVICLCYILSWLLLLLLYFYCCWCTCCFTKLRKRILQEYALISGHAFSVLAYFLLFPKSFFSFFLAGTRTIIKSSMTDIPQHDSQSSAISGMYTVWKFHSLKHRQSKEWTGNAGKSANVADATSAWYGLICFTLEPCNFILNIFQDFVFTYFEQE